MMDYERPKLDHDTGLYIREQAIYIAGKPALRAEQIGQMYSDFSAMGHHITYRWTEADVLKPYRSSNEFNCLSAKKMLAGASMADVFVFFQDEDLHGALEERGAFDVSVFKEPIGKRLYVVEDNAVRQSIFDTLEYVKIIDSTQQIYSDLGRIANLADLHI